MAHTAQPTQPTRPRRPANGTGVRGRLMLLALGAACLLAGLDAALLRLDVWAPVAGDLSARLAALHGPLMLVGFLGSVIALERAVASMTRWAYLAPAAQAAGCLTALAGAPLLAAQLLVLAGAVILLAVYARVYRRAPSTALDVEACGALALLLGDLLWLAPTLGAAHTGGPDAPGVPAATDPAAGVPAAVPLWLLFPVLTIVGERLELARVAFLDPVVERTVRAASVLSVLAACTLTLTSGAHLLLGALLAGLGVIMAWYDVARRTIRSQGRAARGVRFAAASMLAGYAWLVLAGAVWACNNLDGGTGPAYEIVIHCLALGFGFSMILAHAPTIVPAIVHRRLPFHRLMWLPYLLLHVGLAVRVAGLAAGAVTPWQAGGVAGVVAILAFLLISLLRAVTAGSIRQAPARPASVAAPTAQPATASTPAKESAA